MIKCPYCNNEVGFKEVKSWKFRFYDVKRLQCPSCNGIFNHYYGVSSRGRKSEFVIKVKPR
jgi:transposase-like protein